MSHTPRSYLHGHLVIVIDCGEPDRSAQFWTSVLGYARDGPPGGSYQSLVPADGQGIEILLQRVPEVKSGKNRLHLDLHTADLDAEVERVVALGGLPLTSTPVTEQAGPGTSWPIRTETDSAYCSRPPRTGNANRRAREPIRCPHPLAADAVVQPEGPDA